MAKRVTEKSTTEFMVGRYGYDELGKFLIMMSMVLMILAVFVGRRILYLIAVIMLAFGYYRMGSKKIARRKKENELYRKALYKIGIGRKRMDREKEQADKNKVFKNFEISKELGDDGKVYSCYTCRQCNETIKFEEGQGIVKIICPVCGRDMVDRT